MTSAESATSAAVPEQGQRLAKLTALGVCALLIWAAQGAFQISRGDWQDMFWFCNLACPLLGLGCLRRHGTMVRVALTWLTFGTPMWILALATGGEFIVTGALVHLGAPLVAGLALRDFGWQQGTWRFAWLASLTVWLTARLFTPPEANVNLAFRVYPGWEKLFPHFGLYLAVLFSLAALVFFLFERLMLLCFRNRLSTGGAAR